MTSQILTRGQLEKISDENSIFLGITRQHNPLSKWFVTTKQGHIKKLLEITSKIDFLVKKNEELTSHVSVAQNGSKILQEASNTTSSKLVELERKHHKLEQYSRRECLDFSGMPSSVASKDLENFILCLFQEVGTDLDESRIVACHRLGKTDRTIVKFLNRKDAENMYSKKRKLKDVDISCLLSHSVL